MPPRYLIIVEAPPERGTVTRDVRQRIGQWLKIGLRGFGLRAVDVREQPAECSCGKQDCYWCQR